MNISTLFLCFGVCKRYGDFWGQSGWRGSGDTQREGRRGAGWEGGKALPARPLRERQREGGVDTKEVENLGTGEEAASQVAADKERVSGRERRVRGEPRPTAGESR